MIEVENPPSRQKDHLASDSRGEGVDLKGRQKILVGGD